MKISIPSSDILGPFSLKLTLESDQRSRQVWLWNKKECIRTLKILGDPIVLVIEQKTPVNKPELEIKVYSPSEINVQHCRIVHNIVISCFGLRDNLEDFYDRFGKDQGLSDAIKLFFGLRLMRDPNPFESLITGICSQNTSINHWNLMIKNLVSRYGQKFNIGRRVCNLFPEAEKLIANEDELRKCKVGYRAQFIKAAAEAVVTKELDFCRLSNLNNEEARKKLSQIKGVGDKIADYVLLYGLGRTNTLPIDIWMERILKYSYDKEIIEKPINKFQLRRFAIERFGNYVGLAQVYLFFFARLRRVKEPLGGLP